MGVFLDVCAAGSFAAAAVRLGLTPSAVAKAVGRLEQRLGVRLFHRTTRRLALTAEAVAYREVCSAARQRIERVEMELALMVSEPAGNLRISLPPLLGTHVIAPALYRLCDTWPRLRLEISTSTVWAELAEDNIDLAVRIGELPELPGLMARRLGTQRIVLCGSAEYFASRAVPQTAQDLAGHSLLAAARDGRVAPWHFHSPGGELIVMEPEPKLVLDGSLLTLSAIRAGQGIGLVPYWLARDAILDGSLVPILEELVTGHLPINALWIASPMIVPRLRVAIDAVVEAAHEAAEHCIELDAQAIAIVRSGGHAASSTGLAI
ncbi:LysR family transcriptional regulator [Novosphingobium sp. TCA1]|uniref:LysR family transcriptional regulator n=1 Tax=Novosphingobium sp. TCA1 TaxID=2682474 RepID=UPI00130A9FA0|nr:LysR family transcriptional regulator [Novosphingobium sp. TCA1]GFE77910.1 LysR family transcriptional regulator [Novosphingobium sp. TCA1]